MALKTKAKEEVYKLIFYDTFRGEFYSGEVYKTETEALHSAQDKLRELARLQSFSAITGEQEPFEVQDWVLIQYPNGRLTRIMPE
jgi:hypothetical protein